MKQLAFMLGRQQVYLELKDDIEEYDELTEIMSNTHLNNNFLALAREVSCLVECATYRKSINIVERTRKSKVEVS